MTTKRKHVSLTKSETEKLKAAATAADMSVSSYLRQLIEGFLVVGSDYQREPIVESVTLVDSDILEQAERKAQAEHGCILRDIIRYEVAELDKL